MPHQMKREHKVKKNVCVINSSTDVKMRDTRKVILSQFKHLITSSNRPVDRAPASKAAQRVQERSSRSRVLITL